MKLNELLRFDNIAIQCHDFPDADTIASGYAVYKYLKANGKEPLLFYSGQSKIRKANMLIMVDDLEIPVKYITELGYTPELLITVDCAYGESNVSEFGAENVAVIDHHICRVKLPEMFEVRSSYGSCSSVLLQMLLDEDYDIKNDKKLATALYYGLYMDTNMFTEIRHPADKDLRDLTDYDEALILLLKNSNLTIEEMMIVADALKNCEYIEEYDLAISCAKQCDPNILGFTSDLLIQINTVGCCVVFTQTPAGYKISVRSCNKTTNAADLAKYISDGDGGGHAQKAGGFINRIIIENEDPKNYIKEKMISYQRDADILYSGKDIIDRTDMDMFRKKSIILGYIPSCQVMTKGSEVLIRMLEADTVITADEDVYIMVGIAGEVYPINKAVFEKRYIPCEGKAQEDYDYTPSIIDKSHKLRIPLTEIIKNCRAKDDQIVFAKKLTKYTKVFTEWNDTGFLYGRPGDFIVFNKDDESDIYIIKKDIFSRLYSKYDMIMSDLAK